MRVPASVSPSIMAHTYLDTPGSVLSQQVGACVELSVVYTWSISLTTILAWQFPPISEECSPLTVLYLGILQIEFLESIKKLQSRNHGVHLKLPLMHT